MRFHWTESHDILEALLEDHDLVADRELKGFIAPSSPSVRFTPPLLQPLDERTATPQAWLRSIEDGVGTYAILLIQAGASSLGWFDEDECEAHKVIRRYVKRGQGRAQPAHLKTKGKSRYGSRLRLQNAKRQLVETNEKLASWWEDLGAPERVFASVPIRTWPDLMATDPPPPFERESSLRVPFDVHVPDHAELVRIQRLLAHGTVER